MRHVNGRPYIQTLYYHESRSDRPLNLATFSNVSCVLNALFLFYKYAIQSLFFGRANIGIILFCYPLFDVVMFVALLL